MRMNKLKGFGVALVFLAGCAVGGASSRFMVPPASAQQAATLTKWEYSCITAEYKEDVAGPANKLGAQGFELAGTVAYTTGLNTWCFKRPKL